MNPPITVEARRRLAAAHGLDEQYLYQCLTGRRDMNPAAARKLEDESAGELRRWALCQKTWHAIWPELIGVDGAPAVQAAPEPTAQG